MTATALSPLREIRRTEARRPPKLHAGLDALAYGVQGWWHRRSRPQTKPDELLERSQAIHVAAGEWRTAREDELDRKIAALRERFRRRARQAVEPGLLDAASAVLCEVAYRTVRLRPFAEQIMGVLAIEAGCVAEMATGEGKTLTIGLASALAGWRGVPVHVITANDYLVRRDAEWLQPFYARLGLRAGFVTGGMEPPARAAGYAADITYATNREVVADFLRDRLFLGNEASDGMRRLLGMMSGKRRAVAGVVMRGLHTAIIDEADHVLVDEAVTPLIISRPVPQFSMEDAVAHAGDLASQMSPGEDYIADFTYKDVDFTPAGKKRIREASADWHPLWRGETRREELVGTALKARVFFNTGRQYVVGPDGKLQIVDEYTGRLMPDRTWRQGLHQAIEAKEGLALTAPTETLARLSFQSFFRLYRRLSGVTGTAKEARAELWHVYGLLVVPVPTHKPCVRRVLPEEIVATESLKWERVAVRVRELHAKGVPVLVGTRSVEASEKLARLLDEQGLEFALLNARHHEREASIVAAAGEWGRITIATNMAGRGTDIRPGADVDRLGGLHVLSTERHESARVDRQLFGRCARQGQPGVVVRFASLEDEILIRFSPLWMRLACRWITGFPEGVRQPLLTFALRFAQRRAERFSDRSRRRVLKQDEQLDESLAFSPGHG